MSAGLLRAVVCTSSLDLGIDWGDVDLVINVGAPKGSSRLMQRIGRANHRLDEPSQARAGAGQSVRSAGVSRRRLAPLPRTRRTRRRCAPAALDVLAQHVLGCAVRRAVPLPTNSIEEVAQRRAYAELTRAEFDAVVDFVATGGYALKAYERFAKNSPGARMAAGASPIRGRRSNIG